jgi:hypothetical protein
MKLCAPARWVVLTVSSSLLLVSQLRAEGIGMVPATNYRGLHPIRTGE